MNNFIETLEHILVDICVVGFISFLIVLMCILRILYLKRKLIGSRPYSVLFSGFAIDERNVVMTKRTLLLFLLFIGRGYACIYPNSDGVLHLKEGHKLCTASGDQIYIGPHYAEIGLSYYYDTAKFDAYINEDRGCIYGICGKYHECAKMNGRIDFMDGDTIYRKTCQIMDSNIFYTACLVQKSCWIWTQNLKITDKWKVYKTSSLIPFTKHIDNVQLHSLPPIDTMYLVIGKVAYLCSYSSGINDPRKHQLGDIQIVSSNIVFDWDWNCHYTDISYSGNCNIPKSFIKAHIDNYCSMLPATIGGYEFNYVKSSLIVTPTNGWPASTTLELIRDDPSHCHTIEGRIVGREGLNDDSIAIRILGHSDAIVKVNISCYPDLVEIACDEDWHDFPLPKLDECLINGKELSDMRFKVVLEEGLETEETIKPHYYSYMTIILILTFTIIAIVFKLVCKIFC